MKRIILTVLGVFVHQAHAADLYCQGTAWAGGQIFDDSRILTLDKEKGEISVNTFAGMAKGKFKEGPQLYTGFLDTPKSVKYWINLDRYSGEFTLVVTQSDGEMVRVEFAGSCKQGAPRF